MIQFHSVRSRLARAPRNRLNRLAVVDGLSDAHRNEIAVVDIA
jgi:hypothetical protein